MVRSIFGMAFLTVVGCHTSHKVSARVESTGICVPDISFQTLTNGSTDVQSDRKTTPWQREFPSELVELKIDVTNIDSPPGCTQVQCQITVDGAVAVVRADTKHAICEWKR